jgi:hypothetical protein
VNQGDPTVVYLPQYDRWVVSDFAWTNIQNGPYFQCIAVSQTSNPTGAYFLYTIQTHATFLPDYPKNGHLERRPVYDDEFVRLHYFELFGRHVPGVGAYAFNIANMISGGAATTIIFNLNFTHYSMLPGNYRGTAPPAGRPNYFVEMFDPPSLAGRFTSFMPIL